MMFLKAVDPSQVKRPRPRPPPVAAAAPRPPPASRRSPAPAAAPAAGAAPSPCSAPAAPAAASPPSRSTSAPPPTEYPGNDASQAELAKWLSKQAERAGLPPELPVMASLVESGVKNLNFGDRDSRRLLPDAPGIWNQGAYKGYPEKPELQAKWFIDQALALKRKRDRRGRRRLRPGPRQVRRVDRRRRTPRRAVPRPLPAAARRGPQAALQRRERSPLAAAR